MVMSGPNYDQFCELVHIMQSFKWVSQYCICPADYIFSYKFWTLCLTRVMLVCARVCVCLCVLVD